MSNTSDPDSIERELDQTRSRLSGHLDALQGRFSPGQVLDDLMGYFRGNDGADIGRTLLDNVRANPLPAAITGIGLAWLMATNPRSGVATQAQPGSKVRVHRGPSGFGDTQDAVALRLQTAEQGVVRRQDEDEPGYAARLDDARGQAMGLARQAQETTASYATRISEALAAAKQSVVAGAHDLRDQAGNAVASAGSAAQSLGNTAQGALQQAGNALARTGDTLAQSGRSAGQASGSFVTTLADNPVLLGAIGLAAGALLGALLPQSEQEEEALGGVAKNARDTARSLAQGVVDRGGQVAGAVRQAGQDSAQAAGLTGGQSAGKLVDAALSGELAGNVRKVAEDVLRAGDEAIRKEVPKAG